MWYKDRTKIIDNNKVYEYIDKNDFLNLRLGDFEYNSDHKTLRFVLEKYDSSKNIKDNDEVSYQYLFEAKDVKDFYIDVDFPLGIIIHEFNYDINTSQFEIVLFSGNIGFKTDSITLDIPNINN